MQVAAPNCISVSGRRAPCRSERVRGGELRQREKEKTDRQPPARHTKNIIIIRVGGKLHKLDLAASIRE